MLIIPSLYIQEGKAISLYKGQENEQKKVYSRSPLNLAKEFAKAGATMIHLIDLDGSAAGQPINHKTIQAITSECNVPIELGGGVRTMVDVDRLFEIGVSRVILGVSARDLIPEALQKYGPERIIFGLKARRHMVESDSLPEDSDEVAEFAAKIAKFGITQIVYKDMEKQGTLYHPNYDDVDRLLETLGDDIQIYSSGGVAALDDLRILETIGTTGVIFSRAIIEHKISLRDAITQYETTQDTEVLLESLPGTR